MTSALVIANIFLVIVNVCAAAASVTFAIQSSIAMRRMERQRRAMWNAHHDR